MIWRVSLGGLSRGEEEEKEEEGEKELEGEGIGDSLGEGFELRESGNDDERSLVMFKSGVMGIHAGEDIHN